jgi:hypothetical protein
VNFTNIYLSDFSLDRPTARSHAVTYVAFLQHNA